MNEHQEMKDILEGLRKNNNELQYQAIIISTDFPDLPEEVKLLLTSYAIDQEANRAIIRELGANIVAKDKLIAVLQELTNRQEEIINGNEED
jgi:hypothetical protein